MTEYELSDLLLSNSVIMYMDGAAFMTMLSAYIVMVHLVGRSLTKFQIVFINFTFIGLAISSVFGWLVLTARGAAILEDLEALNPNSTILSISGDAGIIVYFTFRSMVVLGALIYMWQVRRSSLSDRDA